MSFYWQDLSVLTQIRHQFRGFASRYNGDGQTKPMTNRLRVAVYMRQNGSERLTPRQRRRVAQKQRRWASASS